MASTNTSLQQKVNLVLQYMGVPTENNNALVEPILVLGKQKTHLPTLKPVIKEQLRSNVAYKLTCRGCQACYLSQTSWQLITI